MSNEERPVELVCLSDEQFEEFIDAVVNVRVMTTSIEDDYSNEALRGILTSAQLKYAEEAQTAMKRIVERLEVHLNKQ